MPAQPNPVNVGPVRQRFTQACQPAAMELRPTCIRRFHLRIHSEKTCKEGHFRTHRYGRRLRFALRVIIVVHVPVDQEAWA